MRLFLFLSLLASASFAEQKFILAGDSWAFIPCFYGTFERAFAKDGIFDVKPVNCLVTSRIGMRAERWNKSSFNGRVLDLLKTDPEIKVVYLSLGGNDLIASWKRTMSPGEEGELFDRVFNDINMAINSYRKLRPDIKILISGYDYANFTSDNKISAYRKFYNRMGNPSPKEMHSGIVRLSERISKLADFKKIFYIHHYGLMHYYFGQSEAGVAPGSTLSPEFISSRDNPCRAGGIPELLQDKKAMMRIGSLAYDAFHLSPTGFMLLASHSIQKYMKEWFHR